MDDSHGRPQEFFQKGTNILGEKIWNWWHED